MHKTFLKAIGQIKRQKDSQHGKPNKESRAKAHRSSEVQDEVSSNEEKRLKQLGVFKKKIHKEPKGHHVSRWRHDKFASQPLKREENSGPIPGHSPMTLYFSPPPGYNKLFQPIKELKIFVREIHDSHVSFNTEASFEQAKQKYSQAKMQYRTQK